MQDVIQNFTIGFFDSSGVFSIYAKQRDVGRYVKFHIYDSLSDEDYYELLSDEHLIITVREQLPDGYILPDIPVDKSNVDLDEMSVSVPLTLQMLQEGGTAYCDLVFASTEDDRILSTTRFKLIIENVPDPSDEPDYHTWTELYVALKALEEQIETQEPIRQANEETRIENENIRISNENGRIADENDRVSAEISREEAEARREAVGTGIIDTAHMWANGMAEGYDVPSATNNARAYAMMAQAVSGLFNGTQAEWDALPLTDKQQYHTVIITDGIITIYYYYNCPTGATENGGSTAPQSKSMNTGVTLRNNGFNAPNKADEIITENGYRYTVSYSYTFSGWNTSADGTGMSFAEGDTYSDNVSMILYAQWAETVTVSDEQYYLTVEADEGVATHTPSQWVDKGDSVNVEATAEKGFIIKSGVGSVEMDKPKTISIKSELIALEFSSDDNFILSVANPRWDGTLEYSTNDGSSWTIWDGGQLSGTANQSIYLIGTNNTKITGGSDRKWTFTGKYCTGNIETLLDYQTVVNGQHPTMDSYCYSEMFSNCTSLVTAPQLPADILTTYCYHRMFADCTSLIIVPNLSATTLADNCYSGMFNGCVSLITIPLLPATSLKMYCYSYMFYNCTSLKLSSTQTGDYQYTYRVPTLGTGTSATNALNNMFSNTGGTFTETPRINTTYYTDHEPV